VTKVFNIADGRPVAEEDSARMERAFEMQDRLVTEMAEAAQLLRDNPGNQYLEQMLLSGLVTRFLPVAADIRTVLAGGHLTARAAWRPTFVFHIGEKK
jgi:hypothetical protein